VSDVLEDLERLVRLRDDGSLTPEEFENRKAILLAAPTACANCRAPLHVDASGRCLFCHAVAVLPNSRGVLPVPVAGGDTFDDSVARAHPGNKLMAIKAMRASTVPPLDLKTAKDRMDLAFARVYGR
jgi:hypothetical protein